MAYVISDSCVSCGTCAGECPVNAISQGDGQYVIDADTLHQLRYLCWCLSDRRNQRGLITNANQYIKAVVPIRTAAF